MPVLTEEVAKLGATIPQQGIAEAIWTKGGLLRGLPFFEGNGTKSHTWNREGSIPISGPVPLGGAVGQATLTVRQVATDYKWFGHDLLFDRRDTQINSNIQNAKAALAVKSAKSLRRLVERYLVLGDASSDPNQFNGLNLLFPDGNAQVIKANAGAGGPLKFGDIDESFALVHEDAQPDGFWMCNTKCEAEIRALIRADAHSQPADLMDDSFGGPFLRLRGRPVLINNFMTNTEGSGNNAHSLWFLGVGEEGLHGRLPLGGNEMITVEDKGSPPGFVQDVIRVLIGLCLVVKSELWVSRIEEIHA